MSFNVSKALETTGRRRRILALACEAMEAGLEPKCFCCGSTERLEFHHDKKRDWVAETKNAHARQALYERDFEAGAIRLLCRSCNARAGVPVTDDDYAAEPF